MTTLEELLAKASDEEICNIECELLCGSVPATGYAHAFCRKVNRLIDAGECCINVTSYRKVYMPTLAKMVHHEAARRYYVSIMTGMSGDNA